MEFWAIQDLTSQNSGWCGSCPIRCEFVSHTRSIVLESVTGTVYNPAQFIIFTTSSCHYSCCIKLFTLSLPLFCLLSWSWPASSTTAPLLPPPSPTRLASETLRIRGYSLFASLIATMSTTANFSGTLLAPPDFIFSSSAAKFLNNRRPPPRPSISLLLYHTIKPPLILAWPTLSSRDDGDEFRTLYSNNCLYLFRSPYGGEISISSSPYKNPMVAIKIRQPDLYVGEHLTVHGIDGVLDPSFAVKCYVPYPDPMASDAVPLRANRTFLDRAMRALRRTGYNVVAAAMAIRRSELLSLTSVTVFAVSDENLFLKPGGFRYNFRHHVVPTRYRFADLAKITVDGTELDTLAPNKTILVDYVDGAVNVDGVAVDETEVYRNRWIVVVAVMSSIDDGIGSQVKPPITAPDNSARSPFPFSIVHENPDSPNPMSSYGSTGLAPENNPAADGSTIGSPSPPSELETEIGGDAPITVSTMGSLSPATDDVNEAHCDLSTVVSVGVEGGDLLCPESTARQLREMDDDVDETKPSNSFGQVTDDLTQSGKVKINQNMNIADDLFFYI